LAPGFAGLAGLAAHRELAPALDDIVESDIEGNEVDRTPATRHCANGLKHWDLR
jgi:hypothetical protein